MVSKVENSESVSQFLTSGIATAPAVRGAKGYGTLRPWEKKIVAAEHLI